MRKDPPLSTTPVTPSPPSPPISIPDRFLRAPIRRGRKCRQFPDLSLTAAAAEMGCSPSYLSYLLSGKRRGSIDMLQKVSATLSIPLETLLSYRK